MAMPKKHKLPYTEDLDFHYLLSLMPPLHDTPEFAWLPELFSIIGHESLITLAKYAGGETIKIPTLNQLADSIQALQWFYDVRISRIKHTGDVPATIAPLYRKICEVYDARDN